MANQRNQSNLAALRGSLEGVETFYLVDYQGLTAAKITKLRKELREKGCRMVVAKNTLVNLALKEQERDFSTVLAGPSAVVIASNDPAGAAKILVDFAKTNDKSIPALKGGMLNGEVVDAKTIAKIAELGTLDDQRAQLVGILGAHLSNFVSILEAYKEKLEQAS